MTAAINFLSSIGVNVASLMTGAGLVGVVVGLGAQTTTRDILAGFFIVGENQYRVGDTIEIMVAGRLISGKVENISLRITQVRDADGKVHTIRNGASEAVTNLSFKYANVNLMFGVSYDTDIDVLEEVINNVGLKMLEDPELNIVLPYPQMVIHDVNRITAKMKNSKARTRHQKHSSIKQVKK